MEESGPDNASNRISNAIDKAYEQLIKYNEPKVLVFLNYSPFLRVEDFEEVYRGYRILEVGNNEKWRDVSARRASEGEIKEKKRKIDLYIWIDTINVKELRIDADGIQTEDKIYFRTTTEAGRNIMSYFGIQQQ